MMNRPDRNRQNAVAFYELMFKECKPAEAACGRCLVLRGLQLWPSFRFDDGRKNGNGMFNVS
jgi:hypothetical protein